LAHAAASVAGLQAAGVAACAKHFPGHGSTSLDSHHVIATVTGSMELITRRDLPPFVAAIDAGVRAIMPGHLRIPELTGDLPASMSAAAQTGLLRGELGFTGVIVSDALEMKAVSGPFGIPEAAVMAVAAGTDLLCFGRDQDDVTYRQVRDALVDAVRSGRLPASRLEESAARVAELRAWVTAARRYGVSGGHGAIAGASDASVGMTAARRAVRVHGTPAPLVAPVLVEIVPPSNIAVGTVPWGLSSYVPRADVHRISTGAIEAESADDVLAAAAGRQLLIVVRDAHRYPDARDVVRALLSARPDATVVEMGLPVWHAPAQVSLATFGATRASSRAAAEVLGLIDEVTGNGPDRP
jgi:beta-N-acetylhexosaminidase